LLFVRTIFLVGLGRIRRWNHKWNLISRRNSSMKTKKGILKSLLISFNQQGPIYICRLKSWFIPLFKLILVWERVQQFLRIKRV
jgi:hypothetical protein